MLFEKPQAELQHSIDRMALPVFVVDRDREGEFRLVALNASHSKSTGLKLDEIVEKTPQMILPKKEDADFLLTRYRACLDERKPIMYSTRLTYCDEIREIRTTLHPVSLDGQSPTRLVGQVTISAMSPHDTVKGALGDQGILAKADIQAIEAILDHIRRSQTVSSNDLMVLGALMNNRSLSLSEVLRLVENFDRARKARPTAEADPGRGPLTELPQAVSA